MKRAAIGAALGVASLLASSAGFASPLGLDGYSGKSGVTCNNCHNGGTAPGVELLGPASVTAGQTADFTFRVQTNAAIVGMAAASNDGVTLTPLTNTKQKFAEVSHISPLAPTGGVAQFTFRLTAPAYNGPITIWAVGNACNNNDSTSGDRATATTKIVTVTGGLDGPPPAPTTPPPGTPPPPAGDGGATTNPTSSDGGAPAGTSKGGPTAPGATNPVSGGTSSNGGASLSGIDESASDEGGLACAAGSPRPSPWAIALAVGLAVLGGVRRRRR